MRFLAALSAVTAVAAQVDRIPLNRWLEQNVPVYAREITVVEPNKAYVVKLDCTGCPFALRERNTQVLWQQPPQDNALVRIRFQR